MKEEVRIKLKHVNFVAGFLIGIGLGYIGNQSAGLLGLLMGIITGVGIITLVHSVAGSEK